MKNNQKGFGLVETLLILVIIGLVGFVGWYVWDSKSNRGLETGTNTNTKTTSGDLTDQQPVLQESL
jgi:hypothetical protein